MSVMRGSLRKRLEKALNHAKRKRFGRKKGLGN